MKLIVVILVILLTQNTATIITHALKIRKLEKRIELVSKLDKTAGVELLKEIAKLKAVVENNRNWIRYWGKSLYEPPEGGSDGYKNKNR